MNATQQKKLSGELQADLQSLLDDALNELNAVRKERDDLKCWKESQLQVDSEWNPQEIGLVLNLPAGANIRASLMPAIQKLIRERDEAQAKCAEMRGLLDASRRRFMRGWPNLHPKTETLVLDFSRAMAEKLSESEKKYGYTDGWATVEPGWPDPLCYEQLAHHLIKGDPRDVANYCAFLWFHKLSTAPAARTDCGKGWVRVSEMDNTMKLLKELRKVYAGRPHWIVCDADAEISRLEKLMEAK